MDPAASITRRPTTNDNHHPKRFEDRTIYNIEKGGVKKATCYESP